MAKCDKRLTNSPRGWGKLMQMVLRPKCLHCSCTHCPRGSEQSVHPVVPTETTASFQAELVGFTAQLQRNSQADVKSTDESGKYLYTDDVPDCKWVHSTEFLFPAKARCAFLACPDINTLPFSWHVMWISLSSLLSSFLFVWPCTMQVLKICLYHALFCLRPELSAHPLCWSHQLLRREGLGQTPQGSVSVRRKEASAFLPSPVLALLCRATNGQDGVWMQTLLNKFI